MQKKIACLSYCRPASGPGAVKAHHHYDPHVLQQLSVEPWPEAPPAAGAVVGPVLSGGEVAGGGGEEDEAAGDDDAEATVEGTARCASQNIPVDRYKSRKSNLLDVMQILGDA